ncbi:MAG: hypothetical protein ACD_15C00165G0004 [uncultured bacterium]|nr:MAG: hypothetical protein ACD_15C00165G0004 [uncultured bacterium]HCU70343.1 hypothetical protein [Candidatus Moranbacteria bacterium]
MSQLDLRDNIIKNVRALVYRAEGGKKFFLLTKEPGGFFTVPGGCKDMDDENLMATLKREMKEELGLEDHDYEIMETGIKKIYKNLYSNPASDRFNKDTEISLFVIKINNNESIKAGCEIDKAEWFEGEAAYNMLNSHHMKEMFQFGIKELKNKEV